MRRCPVIPGMHNNTSGFTPTLTPTLINCNPETNPNTNPDTNPNANPDTNPNCCMEVVCERADWKVGVIVGYMCLLFFIAVVLGIA